MAEKSIQFSKKNEDENSIEKDPENSNANQ
jgi:hypothetical protein